MASTNINDVKITKGNWVGWREQSARPNHSPVKNTFNFDVLLAMSSGEIPLFFSGSCTVGPRTASEDGPLYDKSISPSTSTDQKFSHNIEDLVKSEIHMLAASKNRKEIILASSSFKQAVFQNVQLKLDESDSDLIIHKADMRVLVGITESHMKMEVGEEERQRQAQLKEGKLSDAELYNLYTMGEAHSCYPINFCRLHHDINVADKNKRRDRGIGALMCRRSNEETIGEDAVREEACQSVRSILEDNSDGGTVLDLENGVRRNVAHLMTAGASKDQLLRELWMLSRASLFVGVSAGVQQPSATGSVFAGHQAAYYGVVAAILAAVPVEMATAFWLRRSSSRRIRAFAKALQSGGVVLLIIASAVGGCQLTIKA